MGNKKEPTQKEKLSALQKEVLKLDIELGNVKNQFKEVKKLLKAETIVEDLKIMKEYYQTMLAQNCVLTELRFLHKNNPEQLNHYLPIAVKCIDYKDNNWWMNMATTSLRNVMNELDRIYDNG